MKKRLIIYIFLLVICIAGCSQTLSSIQGIPESEEGSAADEKIHLPELAEDGPSFEIHYIDVGQADAALVLCDGESMLIDGGNRADSSLIYSYLKQRGIEHLDYLVCTHPHEDHAGGLAGALNYATVDVAYAPVTDYDSEVFRNFKKHLEKQGGNVTVPTAGDVFKLGSAEVTVVGPSSMDLRAKLNNISIVLRVVYGDTSFLFTGDAEREEEQAILEAGYEIQSTVLKVGHHGGATSTTYPFLREVGPEYAVISVGKGNSYGHPTEDVLSRLRDADVEVFRTDMLGTVVCMSDGERVSFETDKQMAVDLIPQEVLQSLEVENMERLPDADYVLNIKSMKFHDPTCLSVYEMKESNKQFFSGSREVLIEQEYSPCGRCMP